MRGLATAVLSLLISTPAWCGNAMLHDRMILPPASPAYENSDGDRYGAIARRYGPPRARTDLEQFAERIGIQQKAGRTDLFYRPLGDPERPADSGGPGIAGTFSNGAAQLQLRWDTGR